LDIGQLLDMAYMASRSTKLKALGETKEEFLEGLEGRSFSEAQDCATHAIINFSLKTLPKDQATALKAEIERLQGLKEGLVQAKENLESKLNQEDPGVGEMSTESVEQSESASTPQDAASEN
jgi:hypothetical protein